MTAAWMRRGRRRRGVVWLAVVALLINALVPASLALAASTSAQQSSGWCGPHRRSDAPVRPPATPVCDHCLLCFAPASGLAPPILAGADAPVPGASGVARAIGHTVLSARSSYPPAQPRGPPAPVET